MVPFVRPYRGVFVLMVLTVIMPVAMELIVPRTLGYIIDQGIRLGDMQAILQGSLIMLGAAMIGAVATLGQGVCRAWLSQGLAYDLRSTLFSHVQSFSFGNLDQLHTGQLVTRLSSDVDVVRMFTSAGLALILRALLMICGSLVMVLLIDWQLSIIVVVLLLIAGALIWAVMRKARPLFMLVQQRLAALNIIVQENLAGVSVVKAFVREHHENARFQESSADYMDENIRVGRLMAITMPVLALLTNLGTVAVIWLGGIDVIHGRLTVGELVAFNNYLLIGMAPLLLLGNMLTMVSRAEASSERVMDVLDTQPLVRSKASAYEPQDVAARVDFESASFHYDGNGGGEVLEDVNFSVESGQRIALLGATGSGKTTLVNLIPRFYDVTGGKISVGDVDVRDWEVESLRSRIGVVLQQTTLFSGTVKENIAYGKSDATLDDVVAAAKAAQAHSFIVAMPGGYDAPVEARGANLSGGQRQRIAIARALLISPAVLILDDSTSSVDMETEIKIQDALEQLMVGRTTFIVAQRINSVLTADQILVLDKGRIAAQGTHSELIRSSPIYQEIYRSQLGDDGRTVSDSATRAENEGDQRDAHEPRTITDTTP
jgi:ATP-binding cassette subfamily B protein